MMMCFLCGKEIAWLRSMVDRQYCCAEHRTEARMASSNALREEDDEQELWSVAKSRKKGMAKPGASSQTASVFAFLALAALLVAMIMLPMGNKGGGGAGAFPSGSPDRGIRQGLIARAGSGLSELVRSSAPVTLHHDFRSGMAEWTTAALQAGSKVDDPHDWKLPSAPSVVRPGSLRLWNRSVSLQNYQMEFEGQIEKRSLSWAFRASNAANYYAAKIVITKPGPLPNAGLIHYAMLNGREIDRVQLPLPVTLERGGKYLVRVSVQGDRFVTFLNGQVVSSWTDKRLTRGGVGFFADDDGEQRVAWVSLSERDSFMGRMLSHFSLFVLPRAPFVLPQAPLSTPGEPLQ
ncbi:MAG: hypothetical protein EXQ47_07945 [Bryobacterales bacterium]|nr:hypothetical protein [Bryobacterales bacterium]